MHINIIKKIYRKMIATYLIYHLTLKKKNITIKNRQKMIIKIKDRSIRGQSQNKDKMY